LPVSETKIKEKFNKYIIKNVENYKDYEMVNFGLYDGVTNNRGYAGINKYYEIEYAHKEHEWVKFYIMSDGYDLVSNYKTAENEIKYITITMNLFYENIDEEKIKLKSIYFSKYSDFIDIPATKEEVLNNIDAFEPQTEVNIEKVSFSELLVIALLLKIMICFFI